MAMIKNNQQTMSGMGNMYMVENIKVIQNNHPLPGVFVTLGNSQVETNAQGIAPFDSIFAGKQKIYLYYNNQNEVKTISITGPDTTVTFDQTASFISFLPIVLIVATGMIAAYFFMRRIKNR